MADDSVESMMKKMKDKLRDEIKNELMEEIKKEQGDSIQLYNAAQALSYVKSNTKCEQVKLVPSFQLSDGSNVDFYNEKDETVGAGRLRLTNKLYVDKQNGSMSMPVYITEIVLAKVMLSISDPPKEEPVPINNEQPSLPPSSITELPDNIDTPSNDLDKVD
jgi:hypothetical protein